MIICPILCHLGKTWSSEKNFSSEADDFCNETPCNILSVVFMQGLFWKTNTNKILFLGFRRAYKLSLEVPILFSKSILISTRDVMRPYLALGMCRSPFPLYVLGSRVWLFCDTMNYSHQAPLSMKFSRQEYWSGLPCPLPGDLPNPGIEPGSSALQADYLPSDSSGSPGYVTTPQKREYIHVCIYVYI